MRMAELSSRSGVAIPTIRFYIRAGLMPRGELTSPNQARYGEEHVRRLKLVRSLVEVGGLPIPAVRDVLAFMEAKDDNLFATMGGVQYALTPGRDLPASADEGAALVDALLAQRGWVVRADNPARATLAHALTTLVRLGQDDVVSMLDTYAASAEQLAALEVPRLLRRGDSEAIAEGVIAFDVLGDAILSALRRLAQETVTAQLLSRG